MVIFKGTGRKRWYEAAEILYKYYYKLRRERDETAVVANLIHFMAVFYSKAELAEMSDKLIAEAARLPVIRKGVERVIAEQPQVGSVFSNIVRPSIDQASDLATSTDNENVERLFEEITTALKEEAYEKVIEIVDQAFTTRSANGDRLSEPLIIRGLLSKALAHERLGEFTSMNATCDEVIARFGDSDAPDLQYLTAWSLSDKGMTQIKISRAEEALHTCEEIERKLGALTGNEKIEFTWRVSCMQVMVMIVQKKRQAAVDAFRSAYAVFTPGNETMMYGMLHLVSGLIARDVSERDLIEILSNDKEKADALVPLIVALRQRTGEKVRAPVEVLEVAKDINKDIDAKMAN